MYRAKHYRVVAVSALVGVVLGGGMVVRQAVIAMAPAPAGRQLAVAAAPAAPSPTDPSEGEGPPWG